MKIANILLISSAALVLSPFFAGSNVYAKSSGICREVAFHITAGPGEHYRNFGGSINNSAVGQNVIGGSGGQFGGNRTLNQTTTNPYLGIKHLGGIRNAGGGSSGTYTTRNGCQECLVARSSNPRTHPDAIIRCWNACVIGPKRFLK